MIKTTALRQGTEMHSAEGNNDDTAPTPSNAGWPEDQHPEPEQPRIHRYQFPPSCYEDPCTGHTTAAQIPAGINFPILRSIVQRVRQRNLDHRRKAEDAGYAEGQKQGYKDGYQQGFEAGHRAGLDESQRHHQQQQEWLALINSLWNEVYNLHQSTLLHLGQPLMELISTVVRQVVNHELATSRESIQQLVTDSLAMLPDSKGGQLVINPVDRPLLEPMVKQLPEGWSIQEDDSLTAGGCRLVTDYGDVDATVERRVTACIDAVQEQLISP